MLRRLLFLAGCLLLLNACAVRTIPENLGKGVLNSDDLETVKAGLPAYLLILDGLLENYPKSQDLLATASSLNGAYAGVFIDDPDRRKKMINKSLDYAFRSICLHNKKTCELKNQKFNELEPLILSMTKNKDVEPLYTLGSAWVSYIQENSDDWNAIADLAKAQLIIEQVVALDETHADGQALLYLAVLNSLVPPSLGGQPEVAKGHFETAIGIAGDRNLAIKVMYAQFYARLMFEQELHDQLLKDVLALDPHVDGLTLQNIYAQELAKQLLDESPDFF